MTPSGDGEAEASSGASTSRLGELLGEALSADGDDAAVADALALVLEVPVAEADGGGEVVLRTGGGVVCFVV